MSLIFSNNSDRKKRRFNRGRALGLTIRDNSPIWANNLENYTECYKRSKNKDGRGSIVKANELFKKEFYPGATRRYLYQLGSAMLRKAGVDPALILDDDLAHYQNAIEIAVEVMYETGDVEPMLKVLHARQRALGITKPISINTTVNNQTQSTTNNMQVSVKNEFGKYRIEEITERLPDNAKTMFMTLVNQIRTKRIEEEKIKLVEPKVTQDGKIIDVE